MQFRYIEQRIKNHLCLDVRFKSELPIIDIALSTISLSELESDLNSWRSHIHFPSAAAHIKKELLSEHVRTVYPSGISGCERCLGVSLYKKHENS